MLVATRTRRLPDATWTRESAVVGSTVYGPRHGPNVEIDDLTTYLPGASGSGTPIV